MSQQTTDIIEGSSAMQSAAADAPGSGANFAEADDDAGTRSAFNFDNKSEGKSLALKDKAVSRLTDAADQRKSLLSDQLKQVSGSLGAIGTQQGADQAPQWLTSGVSQATQFIDRLADQVENRSSAELIDDVRTFARQNPAVFLGACALAGFAASRIFAAGKPQGGM